MSTLLAIGLVLLAIVFHELAHLAVIKLLGYSIRGFYIGVPIQIKFRIPGKQRSIEFSTVLFHREFGSFRVGFSWLLFGGAVR